MRFLLSLLAAMFAKQMRLVFVLFLVENVCNQEARRLLVWSESTSSRSVKIETTFVNSRLVRGRNGVHHR